MYTKPHRTGVPSRVLGTFKMAALPVVLVLSLAAIPTSSVAAPGGSAPAGPTLNLSPSQLESLAGSLPTGDLGLSTTGLDEALSSLPALQGLSGTQSGLLQTLLGTLPATTSLTLLLEGVQGVLGIHVTPAELLGAVTQAAHNPAEVAKVIGDLAGGLSPEQLLNLQGILGQLFGNLTGGELTGPQGTLAGLLDGLTTAKLASVLQPLEGVLGGSQLTELQTLLGQLGSLSPTELPARLKELLAQLDPAQLGSVLGELFGGGLSPSQLQSTLTELLGGLHFTTGTAENEAESLGTTVENLASQLGVESKDLPNDTKALTAPLEKEGELLSLLDDLGGLNLSTLGDKGESGSGSGSGAGGNGAGGSGGNSSGGSGTPSSGGSTTVNLSVTPSTSSAQPSASAATKSAKPTVEVKILSHKVRGTVATLVVQVSAAGSLSVKGTGARSIARQVSKAERVTVRVPLTHAGIATLRRHHDRMQTKLRVAFKAVGGGTSSASATVSFV